MSGRDDHVLNLKISLSAPLVKEKTATGTIILRMSLRTLVLLILFLISIFVFMFILMRQQSSSQSVSTLPALPSIVLTPSITPSVTPIEETLPVDDEVDARWLAAVDTLKVMVLNGSGTKGKAQQVADLLGNYTFASLETGNASTYSYVGTEVRIKSGLQESTLISEILSDLEAYDPTMGKFLSECDEYDILIIVGK